MENDYRDLISRNIVQDMMEGVLAIRFDGTISYVNNAAEKILGRERSEMEGKKFASLFFGDEENDEFNQTVLDAISRRSYGSRRKRDGSTPSWGRGCARR